MSSNARLRLLIESEMINRGITQTDMAERLGLSLKHVNRMLRGHIPMSLYWADRIMAELGRSLVIKIGR